MTEIFVGASARTACTIERTECFPYARLGTLFERIVEPFAGTDKGDGRHGGGRGVGVASAV